MSRIYAVPDIHGRLDLLNILLDKLFFEEQIDFTTDKLIFLGDMIDRGPESKGVVDKIRELTETYPGRVIALAGNHEWLCIDAHIRPIQDMDLWLMNGGDITLDSFGVPPNNYLHRRIPDEYVKWMASLPLKHEEPGFFFSHAPAPRESWRLVYLQGQEFTKNELIWTYDRDKWGVARDHGNGIVGVCGHVHSIREGILKPIFYEHYIYADSGCGCSPKAPLVAVDVKYRHVIFAQPSEVKK